MTLCLVYNLTSSLGVVGYVAKHCESTIVQDVRKDIRFDGNVDRKTGFVTRNLLCVPVMNPSNKPVAVIQCANKTGPFTNSDRMSLELIAIIAGHTLHKLELYDVALLAGRKASTMLEIVRAVTAESKTNYSILAGGKTLY